MPYLYYKQKAYGGTSTVNDSEHVIAENGSGNEITSQQLFENILGNIATVEESTTASKTYAVGDYIILNSYFYKVTATIALGDTIAVGTNVVKTTVGDEFKSFSFPVRELTKSQYDALPTAQQNDGTIYLITDGTGGWEAENSVYDNTQSGLTASNVQDALDEVVSDIDSLDASNIAYSNSSSGLSATNVQSALDELNSKIDETTSIEIDSTYGLRAVRNGHVVTLYATIGGVTIGDSDWHQFATIPDGYRPVGTMYVPNYNSSARVCVASNGNVLLQRTSGTGTLTYSVIFSITYIV